MEERESELAWAAGFFDGEGCTAKKNATGTSLPSILISISQNDRRVLDRFVAAVGRGGVYGPYDRPNLGSHPMYAAYVIGYDSVLATMIDLWPYLDEMKQDQFRDAVDWLKEQGGPYGHRGSAMCKEGHERRRWTGRGLLCVDCEEARNKRYSDKRKAARRASPEHQERLRQREESERLKHSGKFGNRTHGSTGTYSAGCRCAECRDALRRYAAKRRARGRTVEAHR